MNERNRRILMTIIGVLISGFSVGMFNLAAFGMDPFQVLAHGVWMHIDIGFGTFYAILNLFMLLFVFIIDRKKIGLGTFINIFLLGYVVEFSSWLFKTLIQSPTIGIRIILLIVGLVILCFGASLYFVADMGVSTYDAVALILSEKKIASFKYCRIASDILCTVVGFTLGATVGIGTVVTALFMGPVISAFNNRISMPLRYGKTIEN